MQKILIIGNITNYVYGDIKIKSYICMNLYELVRAQSLLVDKYLSLNWAQGVFQSSLPKVKILGCYTLHQQEEHRPIKSYNYASLYHYNNFPLHV